MLSLNFQLHYAYLPQSNHCRIFPLHVSHTHAHQPLHIHDPLPLPLRIYAYCLSIVLTAPTQRIDLLCPHVVVLL